MVKIKINGFESRMARAPANQREPTDTNPEDTRRGGQVNPVPPQTGKTHTITRILKNYYM